MYLSTNPIYTRLIRDAQWPSLAVCIRSAFVLAAITLTFGVLELIWVLNFRGMPGITSVVGIAPGLILLALPPVCVVAGADITRSIMAEGELDFRWYCACLCRWALP